MESAINCNAFFAAAHRFLGLLAHGQFLLQLLVSLGQFSGPFVQFMNIRQCQNRPFDFILASDVRTSLQEKPPPVAVLDLLCLHLS